MPRIHRLYLEDIVSAAQKIQHYVEGFEYEALIADALRVDAIERNFIIIGEAVKNIPEEIREQATQIPWREIGRFRDMAVHHYFALNWKIIWDMIQIHLPVLIQEIESLLKKLPPEDTDPND
jgi:uncharacterized protein with HEPN domain